MLRELAGEDEPDGGLYFPARQRLLLVLLHQAARLDRDFVEGVEDERIEDRDGLFGDGNLGMYLLRRSKKMGKGTQGKTTIDTPDRGETWRSTRAM